MVTQLNNNNGNSMIYHNAAYIDKLNTAVLNDKNRESSSKEIQVINQPYHVTISEEGFEKYKELLSESSKEAREIREKQDKYMESTAKAVLGIQETMQSNFHKRFVKANNQVVAFGEGGAAAGFSKNCFSVYASMYNEIRKGYADGTREIWVYDSSSEDGCRKVTEAEELEELDKAFDFYSMAVDAFFKAKDEMQKFNERNEKERSALEAQWKKWHIVESKPEDKTERIYEKLKEAQQLWKKSYSLNMSNIADNIDHIFQLTFKLAK